MWYSALVIAIMLPNLSPELAQSLVVKPGGQYVSYLGSASSPEMTGFWGWSCVSLPKTTKDASTKEMNKFKKKLDRDVKVWEIRGGICTSWRPRDSAIRSLELAIWDPKGFTS